MSRTRADVMESVDAEVFEAALNWRNDGATVWLATVVRTWGSSPRPVGAMAAVSGDGYVVGSVSGGCVEDDLVSRLSENPARCPEVLSYGVSEEQARRVGLPCGGNLQLVVEPITDDQSLREVLRAVAGRKLVCRWLDIATGRAGTTADVSLGFQFDGHTLRTIHGPRWRLLIIGAVQISRYLAQLAQPLDYQVLVCEPRDGYRHTWNVPGADLLDGMPDDVLRNLSPDAHTAVVALTHDPKLDDLALLEALGSDAFYVGALGSKLNTERRRKRLVQLGLTAAQVAQLRGPAGLPIGSKTPAEIAVSIIAELIATRNDNGRRLVAMSRPDSG